MRNSWILLLKSFSQQTKHLKALCKVLVNHIVCTYADNCVGVCVSKTQKDEKNNGKGRMTMGNTKIKKYLITTIIQVLLITVYAVTNFFAFKVEAVVLEPLKYILPLAILFIVIDAISLLLIFKNNKKTNEEGNHE